MKRLIMATMVTAILASSTVWAADNAPVAAQQQTQQVQQTQKTAAAAERISEQGLYAMRDVQVARLALFHGDPEKAKELLAEAGYPNGFECSLYVNGDVRTRSAQIVQAQLAEVGITVDISTYEWGALLDSLNAGDHKMFILGWSNTSFDADGSTYQLFYSENHGATGNRAFLTDEKVDELIIAAQEESDDTKRMGLYKELQDRLHEISPWCPLYYKYDNVGVRADLKGFKLHKGAQHYLGNCHYEK